MATLFSFVVLFLSLIVQAAPPPADSNPLRLDPSCFAVFGKVPHGTEADQQRELDRLTRQKYGFMHWLAGKYGRLVLEKTRYDITTHGFDDIPARLPGQEGGAIFVFGDHFGLSDPILQYVPLLQKYHVRPLADAEQAAKFKLKELGVNPITVTGGSAEAVDAAVKAYAEALWRGENVGMHLQGELNRIAIGNYDGKTMLNRVLEEYRKLSGGKNPRIILSRMDRVEGQGPGHWGSATGFGPYARYPGITDLIPPVVDYLASFGQVPHRDIHLTGLEVTGDFPFDADAVTQNNIIRAFMQPEGVPHPKNTYVPHRAASIKVLGFEIPLPWGEPAGNIVLPEPIIPSSRVEGDVTKVPPEIQEDIRRYFADLKGIPIEKIGPDTHLSKELGLDSVKIPKIYEWLESKPQYKDAKRLNLTTVGDVMLVAAKLAKDGTSVHVRPPPPDYFRQLHAATGKELRIPQGMRTELEGFAIQLKKNPHKVFIGDAKFGYYTYAQFDQLVEHVRARIDTFEGDNVGVMMPKSVMGRALMHAIIRAGKIPFNLNFTQGQDAINSVIEQNHIKEVVTAQQFIGILKGAGAKVEKYEKKFRFLEGLLQADVEQGLENIGLLELIGQKLKSAIWRTHGIRSTSIAPEKTAVVLMTSGSSGVPKQVPLTHSNLIGNLYGVAPLLRPTDKARALNALPDFHSFGNTLSTVLETIGVPEVVAPNPTNGAELAKLVEYNKITHLALTPTFANLMIEAAKPGELDTLEVIILGAEKVPESLLKAIKLKAPNARVLKGYGITENSPVVTLQELHVDPAAPVYPEDNDPTNVGPPIPGVQLTIYHPREIELYKEGKIKELHPLPIGYQGIVVTSGQSTFNGYLNYSKPQPFVPVRDAHGETVKGFNTEDLGSLTIKGHLKLKGRAIREAKLSGERVSLDGLEDSVNKSYGTGKPPWIAIEKRETETEHELYLFTTDPNMTREEADRRLREGGAPTVASIKGIVLVPKAMTLGTGKTNYGDIKKSLTDEKVISEAQARGGSGPSSVATAPPAPKILTRAEVDEAVKLHGRLPVEKIDGQSVDLSEVELALHFGIAAGRGRKGQLTPRLFVRGYNYRAQDGSTKRGVELYTEVPMTAEEVRKKLDESDLKNVNIRQIHQVGYLPITADGRHPNYNWPSAGKFEYPPGVN